jgi:hypothetical protein
MLSSRPSSPKHHDFENSSIHAGSTFKASGIECGKRLRPTSKAITSRSKICRTWNRSGSQISPAIALSCLLDANAYTRLASPSTCFERRYLGPRDYRSRPGASNHISSIGTMALVAYFLYWSLDNLEHKTVQRSSGVTRWPGHR